MEKFDYTEWQRNLWDSKSVDDIFYAAKAYREKMEKSLLQGNHENCKTGTIEKFVAKGHSVHGVQYIGDDDEQRFNVQRNP